MSSTWSWSPPVDLELWIVLFYVAALLIGAKIVEAVARMHFARSQRYGERGFEYIRQRATPIVVLMATSWNCTECRTISGSPWYPRTCQPLQILPAEGAVRSIAGGQARVPIAGRLGRNQRWDVASLYIYRDVRCGDRHFRIRAVALER